jgi:hypothetical protein
MKLTLDHTQRLNLHAFLAAQRADVGSIRAIWSIQDRIALDSDEEKAVEAKREIVAGQERVVWNPAQSLAPREFELSDPGGHAHPKCASNVGILRCRYRSPMAGAAYRGAPPV